MISVMILINGKPICGRSAVNVATVEGITHYEVDDGSTIKHVRDDGAVPLAIKMLQGMKVSKGAQSK